MDLTGVKVVSWDVDGTLYSLPKMIWRIVRHGVAELFRGRVVRMWRELTALTRFRRMMREVRRSGQKVDFAAMGIDREQLLEYERRWYAPAIGKTGLRGGVRELIEQLRARGIRQIVVSDYVSNHKLEVLGLGDAFDAVYAGETLGFLKPAPGVFEQVLAAEGIAGAELLHIGDRVSTDGAAVEIVGSRALILGSNVPDIETLLRSLNE